MWTVNDTLRSKLKNRMGRKSRHNQSTTDYRPSPQPPMMCMGDCKQFSKWGILFLLPPRIASVQNDCCDTTFCW